ncbi:MAG: hypothetical protein KDJ38_15995 [Gammaproteobacteria bacterium]|nr:hypothetical protein [Gammaproteobacteria bacterium]
MKSARAAFLFLGIFCNAPALAEITYPIVPEEISGQIRSRGIDAVHQEIFSDPLAINMFLLAVDSAQADWLVLAEKFLALENPASHERLLMAIGEGLQWGPENVFQIDSFPLLRICSLDGLYEWRRFSRFLAEVALQRRIEKVSALDDKRFAAKKSLCLQTLAKAREKIQQEMNDFVSP